MEGWPWWIILATAALVIGQLFFALHAMRLLLGDDELPDFRPAIAPFISVVVPARNEAGNIGGLLNDLRAQDYPLNRFEVIVVDDGSEDNTAQVVEEHLAPSWKLLLSADGEGKKAAIEQAVRDSHGDVVLVTDADARCGPLRLRSIARAWQREPFDLLLMPITVTNDGNWLQELQTNEQLGFMAVAAASARGGRAVIANGANIAFRRSTFELLGGFQAHRHIASGDDQFLLRSMQAANKSVGHLATPEVVVHVRPETGWAGFIQQRLRWAGKMTRGGLGTAFFLPALALLVPILLWASTLMLFTAPVERLAEAGWMSPDPIPVLVPILLWLGWGLPIVVLAQTMGARTGQRVSTIGLAGGLVLFTIYAPIIAVLSLFMRSTWKGRRV